MMFSEHLRAGLNSIRQAKFRSFFTMIGIIIGVVSVVTIISLGEGVKRQITGQSTDLGTNLITVKPGNLVERDDSGKISGVNLFASTGIASITQEDVESIKKIDGVKAVAPLSTLSALPKYNDQVYKEGMIIASTPALSSVIDQKIEFGTYFNEEDATKKTAVIGPKVAERLYREAVPIGKSVEIRGTNFTIQGVFTSFSEAPITSGIDLNNVVFISDQMAKELIGVSAPIYEVLVKRESGKKSGDLINEVTNVVRENHGGQDDFTILDQKEASVASDELLKLLTRMIIGMAGVTLFIGGIGIMNVMLVSVSERNREIGIRKSIGATDRQIRNQFVLESTILSIWGVIIGIIVSGLLNLSIRIFTDLEPVLMWEPIVATGLISVAVGIFFGSIPAIKASKKDPIDSFRA